MKIVYLLYCVSGFVSLAYQVAWFRIFVDRFGSTNLTFTLVLCNFLGGLGAGSLCSRRLVSWLSRRAKLNDGLRVYGLVEILVAVAALLTLVTAVIPPDAWGTFPYRLHGQIYQPTAVYRLSQVLIAALCVFVPCFFMGVTFPLLCSVFGEHGRFPSALYGWNTLGACSGVLACEFLFLPQIGHNQTFEAMAAVNFALGLFFVLLGSRFRPATAPARAHAGKGRKSAARDRPKAKSKRPEAGLTYPVSVAIACGVISGLLAGALEADLFKRVNFLGCWSAASMSFISFWAIVAIFLASWTVRALPGIRLNWIKAAYAVGFAGYLVTWHYRYPLVNGFGVPRSGLGSLLLFTGIFVFPAYYPLSLLLPYVCNAMQQSRRHLGLLYGLNTLAFCMGMFGFTWVAPRVNLFYSLKLFVGFFAVLLLLLLIIRQTKSLAVWKPAIAVLLVAGICAATPASFDPTFFARANLAARYPIRAMKSNAAHTTFVVEDPVGDRLFFDSHSMSATSLPAQRYMRLMAHFPLLLHPHPQDVLLICFGVGNTASAIACHDTVRRIDAVDLNHRVLETAPEFAATNQSVIEDPRLRLIHDDGRRFLNRTDRRYDLVTSEPPPPMQVGVYRLYSQEYYESVLAHLTPGGMMTQWLPTHEMPKAAVDRAVSTFVNVFPHSLLLTGYGTEFILLGSNAPVDLAILEKRFHTNDRVLMDLRQILLPGPLNLLARIVKCEQTLRKEYGPYPSVSDLRNDFSYLFDEPGGPVVITYNPVAVLEEADMARLRAYPQLRQHLLHLGRLRKVVPDFPIPSLRSVRTSGVTGVALADADWNRIEPLVRATLAARAEERWDDAIRHAQQALAIADELPYTIRLLGECQTRDRRFDAALATWDRLQQLCPDDADGYHGQGWVLRYMKRYADALVPLHRALQINPHNPRTHLLVGDAHFGLGDLPAAIRAYDQALAFNPHFMKARANRDRAVAQLKGQ